LNIVSEKHNPFLKRKEIMLSIEHSAESTPSKAAVQELLAKQLSADKEKIEIIDIISETGLPRSRLFVYLWEEVPVRKVKKAAEKEEKAEAPKEEKKEVATQEKKKETKEEKKTEAPKEEKKEEKKE